MLIAQVVVIAGQFVYAAITARLVSPEAFGAFAASLSLVGLLSLLTTNGIPSFVHNAIAMNSAERRRVRLLTLSGSAVAAMAYALLIWPWLGVLNAELGRMYTVPLIVAVLLAPPAAVEFAIVRMRHRAKLDSLLVIVPFMVGTSVAAAGLVQTRDPFWLAVAPAVTAAATYSLCVATGTGAAAGRAPAGFLRKFVNFVRPIIAQSAVSFVLGQAPLWLVGSTQGARDLGQYSRAQSLTGMLSAGIGTAIARGLQPHWRNTDGAAGFDRALRDLVVLAGFLSFMGFGLLGGVGVPFVYLWLGSDWGPAANLIPALSMMGALQLYFMIISSALETTGRFRPIRRAQMYMLIALVPVIVIAIYSQSLLAVALLFSALQLVGAVTMTWLALGEQEGKTREIGRKLALPLLYGFAVFGCSWAVSAWIADGSSGSAPISLALAVGGGGLVGVAVSSTALCWGPLRSVLRTRK